MSDALRTALKNQYHAGLATLHRAVELCPDELGHHAAQLADRLRNEAALGVGWVSGRPRG